MWRNARGAFSAAKRRTCLTALQRDLPNMKPLVIIPARMASSRLPGKPLADIDGKPMIVRVCERAAAANIGPVLVAAAEQEIIDAVEAAGFAAVMTDPDLPSGSDRVWAAAQKYDPAGAFDVLVNLQGDMPTLDPAALSAVLRPLNDPACDIATLASVITHDEERDDPNVVKAVLALKPDATEGRALYFTRATAPTGDGPLWHHVGVYAYRRASLERFVSAPPSALEQRESLEQLRALEIGMQFGCSVLTGAPPNGVDTPADLEAARLVYAGLRA
jgi:3-deoxy-manno-octulosonate cytidylyltransferase (CMP-KDO synthetase)